MRRHNQRSILQDVGHSLEGYSNGVDGLDISPRTVTAEQLEAFLTITNQLVAGNPGAARVEVGSFNNGSTTLRGMEIFDSNNNITGQFTDDGTLALGTLTVGNIISDRVVSIDSSPIRLYVDPINGSDSNDGMGMGTFKFADTFNRVTTSGWGDCSDGFHSWTRVLGAVGAYSTTTTPNAKIAAAASTEYVMMCGAGDISSELLFKVQTDKTPTVAVCGIVAILYGRDADNFYKIGISIPAGGGTPQARLLKETGAPGGGAQTAIANNGNALTGDVSAWAVNTDWWIRVQAIWNPTQPSSGGGETTIRMKAWKSSNAEPANWDQVFSETEKFLMNSSGSWGLGVATGAIGNPNITVTFSSLTITPLDQSFITDPTLDSGANIASFVIDTSGSNPASATPTAGWNPTTTGPLQTIQAAVSKIPPYYNGEAHIIVGSSGTTTTPAIIYENVNVWGIVGAGNIFLHSASIVCGGTWQGTISFGGMNSYFHIDGFAISDTGGGVDILGSPIPAAIFLNSSGFVEVFNCTLAAQTGTVKTANIAAIQGSRINVTQTQMNNAVNYCVISREASIAYMRDCTGAGVTKSYRAQFGGIVITTGTTPTGGIDGSSGGISADGGIALTNVITQSGAGTTAIGTGGTRSGNKTNYWPARASGTYGTAYGTFSSDDNVVQGAYGGSQNHIGMWTYPDTVQSVLSGTTIKSGYITVRRLSGYGSAGAQTVYIVSLNTKDLSSAPSVVSGPVAVGSIAWGQTKTFQVPLSILNDLKTAVGGHTRNLGVFIGSGLPYVGLAGVKEYALSGRLKITHT